MEEAISLSNSSLQTKAMRDEAEGGPPPLCPFRRSCLVLSALLHPPRSRIVELGISEFED